VELKEISIGDRIATVRRLPPGEDDVKEYEAFVIGAMLGDGGCIYSDIYWDKVVAIEPMGEAQTFDITMEGEPNFIANDIVVHNSIAYLLPAIHFSVQNGERVVISTNTINLQDQLFKKDIPDIKKILPFDFKASLLKGRTNYICLRRLEAFRHSPNFSSEEMNLLAKILVWLPSTMTGDQAELFIPSAKEGSIWRRVSSDAEACLAERCSFRRKGKCFFYRARRGAESAHLIIVNHALLLADVAVENRVLPDYNYLIVDEAHHLEEACTKQLSFAVDQGGVIGLLSELSQSLGGKRRAGFLADVMGHLRSALPDNIAQKMERFFDDLHEEVDSCERSLYEFFNALALFLEKEEGMEFDIKTLMYSRKVRLTPALRTQPSWAPVEMAWDNLSSHFLAICNGLERLYVELSGLEDYEIQEDFLQELIGYINRVGDLREQMEAIVVKPKPSGIYWAEISAKGGRVSLHAAPLHVGNLIERHIFSPKECVILTSATLQTEGNFDYIRERLWAWDVMEKAVGSPFDYKSSTLLYIPNDIPEPYQPYYQKTVERAIVELCRATGGRTLVLFTSHSQLRATSGAISRPLAEEEIVVYSQGEGISRNQLLERFRSTPRAVLLGTRSFWEGIDVVGPALSCIVIARLPFSVPTDPIFAARSETFEDPFLQYAIPEAILRFRQGFGRLIRSKTDRGVVVVLDKRIITKPYGRAFLNSIPPCTVKIGTLEMLPQETIRWIEGHL
jgi:DNA polymerase-3 subunit epsilon/ATP-dependent DNA helicase DinG